MNKICKKCNEEKLFDLFVFEKRSNKYTNICNECKTKYQKEYYQQNKKHILEKSKIYNQKNKDQISESHRKYKKENKQRLFEYHKIWDDNDSSTWMWQIDHIIPQSDLLYTSMKDENFKKCWALENLRPLSAKQNFLDGVYRVRHKKGELNAM